MLRRSLLEKGTTKDERKGNLIEEEWEKNKEERKEGKREISLGTRTVSFSR